MRTILDRECYERGCACVDDRVDKDTVAIFDHTTLLRQALEALEDMKAEFRALDLPYGSKAYVKANEVCHAIKKELKT